MSEGTSVEDELNGEDTIGIVGGATLGWEPDRIEGEDKEGP